MRLLSYLFIFFAFAFSVFTLLRILSTFSLFDYVNGYDPAVRDLVAGRGLYDNPNLDINYPPSAFLFVLPIRWLDVKSGQKLWTVLSFAALITSVTVLLLSMNKLSWYRFFLIYSFAMMSFPIKFTLGLGQINLFILLLISLAYFFWQKKLFAYAGICIGIASAIKITPAVLILFFLKKGNWTTIMYIFLSIAVSVLLSGYLFGWNLYRQYLTEVIPTLPTVGNASYYNQALTGFLARGGIPIPASYIINAALFSVLLITSYTVVSSKDYRHKNSMEYGVFICAVLVGSGLTWQHHLSLMLIPFIAVYFSGLRKHYDRYVLLILSFLLVSTNIKHPEAYTGIRSLVLSHGLYGTLLLWYLLVAVIRAEKIPTQS